MDTIAKTSLKLGTLSGVFIPNFLQMAGVIVFLRLGWILGHVGLVSMSLIITFASSLLLITSLSFSSIVSNMKVGGGGGYYIFSRILGIEFGSAIGILLCLMQIAAISLCISGFSLSFQEFFPRYSIELIEIVALSTLALISFVSMRLTLKIQLVIFLILCMGLISIFLGSAESLSHLPINENATLPAMSFWLGFAMFFPATTGIEAGMSLSGELKNPNRSLPIGTILSVISALALYLCISIFLSSKVSAELLRSHPTILFHVAKIDTLVFAGVWGSILSSALSNLLGTPRIVQTIAKDGILSSSLAKGPFASLFVFGAALMLTLATDLNHLIPILTMVCLASYALINFVAFFEGFIRKPSWRPSFRIPWILSLLGCIACFFSMFMINAGAAFLFIALTIGLCLWTSSRKVQGNWDDIRHSLFSFLIHRLAAKLSELKPNPKSWRPNILTLFSSSTLEKNLAYFSHALDQGKGFLIFATSATEEEKEILFKQRLEEYHIPAYVHVNISKDSLESKEQIIKNYGFGPLQPNTIILPLKSFPPDVLYPLLRHASDFGKNILLLKDDIANPRLYAENSLTPKQINLWWRGQNQRNFELCLALSYILQGSTLWANSRICIKSIVKDDRTKTKLLHIFQRYQERLRIKNIVFSPIVDPKEAFFRNLKEYSHLADFTFLGLKMPSREDERYEEYISSMLQETKELSNLAFVLAGEDLNFEKIFNPSV